MDIAIFGKKIEIPDWFKEKITKEIEDITQKYFQNIIDGSVSFSKVANLYHCQIHVHASRSLSLRGESKANDVQEAFTVALEHLGNRLKRYKNRLITRRDHTPPTHEIFEGNQYTIDHTPSLESNEGIKTEKQEKILTKKSTHIETLTVNDAIMILDLSERPVLMFRNAENHRINVIYRQEENKVIWLDPGNHA